MKRFDRSLRVKLVVAFLALVTMVTVFVATYFPGRMDAQGREWMLRHADGTALLLANAVAPGLEFNDRKSIETQLAVLITSPEVVYVAVLAENGRIFAAWHEEQIPWDVLREDRTPFVNMTDEYVHLGRPILAKGGTRGNLILGISLDELTQEREQNRRTVGIVAAILFVVGSAIAGVLGTVLVRPIRRLTGVAREVAGGNLSVEGLVEDEDQPRKWRDEVRALTSAISAMASQITAQIKEIDDQRHRAEAERERAEAESERAREAEEKALLATKTKSAFLANMSHELRTPLTAIMGYSTILQRELKDKPSTVDDLKKINAAGQHLLELINDILDLSKIEAGRVVLSIEPFGLNDLIHDIKMSVEPLVRKNNNQLEVLVEGDLGTVELDRTRVRQILLNLLSNASKFTSDGTVTLRALRSPGFQNDWITVSVEDTGIGIPPDKLESIFEAFSQADSSTTREYGGTGLGLAITRQFCEMMNGEIDVASTVADGSVFTVRLPAIHIEEEADDAEMTDPGVLVDHLDTVLVIDDDPAVREYLVRFLPEARFQVMAAANGQEAQRLARESHPSSVLLDILMPGRNGWTIMEDLRHDAELKDVPVIMMSVEDAEERALQAGAVGFLPKPIDEGVLLDLLDKHRVHAPRSV